MNERIPNHNGIEGAQRQTVGLSVESREVCSAPQSQKRADEMVIKGIETDYAMEKARIDSEGYDVIQSLSKSCDICGKPISDKDDYEEIDGVTIGECCQEELGNGAEPIKNYPEDDPREDR